MTTIELISLVETFEITARLCLDEAETSPIIGSFCRGQASGYRGAADLLRYHLDKAAAAEIVSSDEEAKLRVGYSNHRPA